MGMLMDRSFHLIQTLSLTFTLTNTHIQMYTITFLLYVWAPPCTAGANSMNNSPVLLWISHGPHYLCLRYSKKLHFRQSVWLPSDCDVINVWLDDTYFRKVRLIQYLLVFNWCLQENNLFWIRLNQSSSTNLSPAVMLMKVWTVRMFI